MEGCWIRISLFDKSHSRSCWRRETIQGIANLFSYAETWISFQEFRKYSIKAGTAFSTSILIRFDASIKDLVDSLKSIIESSQHANSILHYYDSGGDLIVSSGKVTNAKVSGKSRKSSGRSSRLFRALLPLAASQLVTNAMDRFTGRMEINNEEIRHELSFRNLE